MKRFWLTLLAAGLAGCGNSSGNVAVPEKPVLYLYPEEEMEVTVTLDFDGTLTSTYPAYGDGWTSNRFATAPTPARSTPRAAAPRYGVRFRATPTRNRGHQPYLHNADRGWPS